MRTGERGQPREGKSFAERKSAGFGDTGDGGVEDECKKQNLAKRGSPA